MLSLKGIFQYNINNKCCSYIKNHGKIGKRRNYENRSSEKTVLKREREVSLRLLKDNSLAAIFPSAGIWHASWMIFSTQCFRSWEEERNLFQTVTRLCLWRGHKDTTDSKLWITFEVILNRKCNFIWVKDCLFRE